MKAKTQTQLKNFIVTQDGAVVLDTTPTATELARERLVSSVGRIYGNVRLEARMVVFDALHGTQYRQIRHDLMREKRLRAFERSIGLTKK